MTHQFDAPFIAIEGPIGVGKTSLSTMLGDYYQFHLLKEIVDENPFLSKFYENIDEWSFQTEMFFLCNRFKQLEDVYVNYLANDKPVISDYHIFKNHLFAKQTLHESHFQKYDRIYSILTGDLPKPNLIIYLDASLDTLMDRIKLRGREMEQAMSIDYLNQLSHDYRQFMKEHERVYPHIPVIRIDGDKMDFVSKKEDFNRIVDQIDEGLKRKRSLL
ncbi:deoxynucleoside kinase [Paenalkalicoccus suaedae]|uniref:Deoxynucleoside kinase n=1 Tax=Paenalkalicoccus suaedae TaxID=2592382 RepID=A0A859FDJ9_9BACI|nr:deoxynucleoside kinase [Paenalkalicoccus suaedae]QKS71157.1 deoxynucleoside kinase [Paenalkalicoccus suaedae]